jgi:hypothetical protein
LIIIGINSFDSIIFENRFTLKTFEISFNFKSCVNLSIVSVAKLINLTLFNNFLFAK